MQGVNKIDKKKDPVPRDSFDLRILLYLPNDNRDDSWFFFAYSNIAAYTISRRFVLSLSLVHFESAIDSTLLLSVSFARSIHSVSFLFVCLFFFRR